MTNERAPGPPSDPDAPTPEPPKDHQRAMECLQILERSTTLDAEALACVTYLSSHPHQWFRIRAAEHLAEFAQPGTEEMLACGLNDRSHSVVEQAALALSRINSPRALEIVTTAYLEDDRERPQYLAHALAYMGDGGFDVLMQALSSPSPTMRYCAAQSLGATLREEVVPLLEEMAANDHARTKFGGLVSTGARKGLRLIARGRARA